MPADRVVSYGTATFRVRAVPGVERQRAQSGGAVGRLQLVAGGLVGRDQHAAAVGHRAAAVAEGLPFALAAVGVPQPDGAACDLVGAAPGTPT